jgi:hypothetical protein
MRFAERLVTREALIARLRDRVEWDGWPRCTVTLMVALAGLASFVSSAVMLRVGLDSMAVRYGLAAVVGYVAFLGLVRLWIAAQRGSSGPEFDPISDGIDGLRAVGDVPRALGVDADVGGFGFDFDLEGLFVILLVLLLALGGLFAIGYVVYAAPALLAEVMLDAAIVASVSKKLKPEESRWWAGGVVSRTVFPAAALVFCVSLAGYAFSLAAPDAHSIGGVVRELLG